MSSSSNRYRPASREEKSKILHLGYRLDELFDDSLIEDFLTLARLRVLREIRHATVLHRGRRKGTDNYVIGVGGKQSEFAQFVLTNMRKQFVMKFHLPQHLQELAPKFVDHIVRQAHYGCLLDTINAMVDADELRYDEARGTWEITQSAMDEYDALRQRARTFKHDRRNYHGRVRGQSRRRGIPPGVSCGGPPAM